METQEPGRWGMLESWAWGPWGRSAAPLAAGVQSQRKDQSAETPISLADSLPCAGLLQQMWWSWLHECWQPGLSSCFWQELQTDRIGHLPPFPAALQAHSSTHLGGACQASLAMQGCDLQPYHHTEANRGWAWRSAVMDQEWALKGWVRSVGGEAGTGIHMSDYSVINSESISRHPIVWVTYSLVGSICSGPRFSSGKLGNFITLSTRYTLSGIHATEDQKD